MDNNEEQHIKEIAENYLTFEFGFQDATQQVMIVFIPLQRYADDSMNGTAILRGKLDELKSIALLKIQEMRRKKDTLGVI